MKYLKQITICTLRILILPLFITLFVNAQTEFLTNADIIAMSKAGLSVEIIIGKIKTAETKFDTSVQALIELKSNSVDDQVINAVVRAAEKTEKLKTRRIENVKDGDTELSESAPAPTRNVDYKTPAELLREAKTIAFKKGSAFPKIKDLEGSLLKRERITKWNKFNLTITNYEADADLLVEIGHDFLTDYNFRVIDVKTGRVIAASGVSSLGGALAGNVADKLIKKLNEVLNGQ